jgi:plasmid replication initiation protein
MATISKKTSSKKVTNKAFISNQLIESFIKKGNVTAFKILFFIARTDIKVDADVMLLKIDVKTLCDYCKIDVKTLHRNVEQMTETSISITDDRAKSYITVLPWAEFDYNGTLKVKMFREVLELIKKTKNQFTVIDALQIVKLKSKHSIRMTMLLEYIANFDIDVPKRKHYTLDELNLMFGTKYSRLLDFDRKILKPVKEELDNNSKLSFVYDLKYDKETATVGRAKAVGVIIDVINNSPRPKLF